MKGGDTVKYVVTCGKCKCDFELLGKYLIDKAELSCPNCNTALSEKALNNLKTLEAAYQQNKSLSDFGLSVNVEATLKGSSVSF